MDWNDVPKAEEASYWHSEGYFIGKTIKSVTFDEGDERKLRWSDDPDAITIEFEDETWVGTPYGDCCSSTWIEHVTVPRDIEGALITGIKEASIEELDSSDPRYKMIASEDGYPPECIRIYWTAIQTTKGEIILEYRNSSNGYYGGNISWSKR